MNDESRDHVADLKDRVTERQLRGENWEAAFEVEFEALTDEEKDYFVALTKQRIAHAEEQTEAIASDTRICGSWSFTSTTSSPSWSSSAGFARR